MQLKKLRNKNHEKRKKANNRSLRQVPFGKKKKL